MPSADSLPAHFRTCRIYASYQPTFEVVTPDCTTTLSAYLFIQAGRDPGGHWMSCCTLLYNTTLTCALWCRYALPRLPAFPDLSPVICAQWPRRYTGIQPLHGCHCTIFFYLSIWTQKSTCLGTLIYLSIWTRHNNMIRNRRQRSKCKRDEPGVACAVVDSANFSAYEQKTSPMDCRHLLESL